MKKRFDILDLVFACIAFFGGGMLFVHLAS